LNKSSFVVVVVVNCIFRSASNNCLQQYEEKFFFEVFLDIRGRSFQYISAHSYPLVWFL